MGGGFLFFLAFRIVVLSVGGWARVAVVVIFLRAGLAIVFGVREARTRQLPPDAERFVRAQRRERRRRAANPRNWWPAISARPTRSAVIAGFSALVIAVVVFAPTRDTEPEREDDLPTLEELCESPPFGDPAFRPTNCPRVATT